jgi:prepilin-type N-terminal cleavage/methylation domain-containing protein
MKIPPHCRRLDPRAAFTLVELMVTMVIVAMLAALTLSGLAGVRQRAKIDKTRSTIRKINEIVLPHYESYLTRRVPQAAAAMPSASRLWGLRLLMTLEMPDQWSDVVLISGSGIPPWSFTAPVKRYAAMKTLNLPSLAFQDAECLAMIVMRGGFDPDALESFRADEIGDVDKDRCPEFLDGWGKPIGFIRWPVGFDSPLQLKDASANPDPFDPMRRSQVVTFPFDQTDYGITPLIFSGGADAALDLPELTPADPFFYGGYYAARDISLLSSSWLTTLTSSTALTLLASGTVPSTRTIARGTTIAPGAPQDVTAIRDNITNFDLLKK